MLLLSFLVLLVLVANASLAMYVLSPSPFPLHLGSKKQQHGAYDHDSMVPRSGNDKHNDHERRSRRTATAIHPPYDYVVVGSGPGGGPLAANLAIAGFKVLLIDAGGDPGLAKEYLVPALHLFASEYKPQEWDYFVNHYADLSRQEQDSKMNWKTPSGNIFVGQGPPAGS
jgi:choline dehydrogenase